MITDEQVPYLRPLFKVVGKLKLSKPRMIQFNAKTGDLDWIRDVLIVDGYDV